MLLDEYIFRAAIHHTAGIIVEQHLVFTLFLCSKHCQYKPFVPYPRMLAQPHYWPITLVGFPNLPKFWVCYFNLMQHPFLIFTQAHTPPEKPLHSLDNLFSPFYLMLACWGNINKITFVLYYLLINPFESIVAEGMKISVPSQTFKVSPKPDARVFCYCSSDTSLIAQKAKTNKRK